MSIFKTPFVNHFELTTTPTKELKTFGVIIQNQENTKLIDQVHYEIDVKCINSSYYTATFEFTRKQVYINEAAPDYTIDQLVYRASTVIFPIQITSNSYGQIDAIANYTAIVNRWEKEREELLEFYEGAISKNIVSKIDQLINNPEELKQSLYKNWFFCMFFSPLYHLSYGEERSKKIERKYPVFGNNTVLYEADHTVDKLCSDTGKILIRVQGKAIDERTCKEVLDDYNYPKAKMTNPEVKTIESDMSIVYKLHSETGSLYSVFATFTTPVSEKIVKTTQVEIYHLNE
jgi:hypothetical protein